MMSPPWTFVHIAMAILCSFALACGMPFAALGAVAALTLTARGAFAVAGLGWVVNQITGFGSPRYPLDTMTLVWGIALGLSSLAAVGGARLAARFLNEGNEFTRSTAVFVAAWVTQTGIVFLASLLLGRTATAFTAPVICFVFSTNALVLVVLLGTQLLGVRPALHDLFVRLQRQWDILG